MSVVLNSAIVDSDSFDNCAVIVIRIKVCIV